MSKESKSAGGVPAIVATLKSLSAETGLIRGARTMLKVNQPSGIDCPGCAWPEPDQHRSHFEFCENGAKLIADELNSLNYPDQAIFYTSGRTSNEAAFLYQLFVRQFGTNNLPDCSNMCHESSGTALTETIGVGKGTVTLGDFARAQAIVIIGQNPGTNHPRMLTTLEEAKRAGATIVSINPLDETGLRRFKHPQDPRDVLGRGTRLADLVLRVRVNGDVAVLQGLAKALLEREDRAPGSVLDREFVRGYT